MVSPGHLINLYSDLQVLLANSIGHRLLDVSCLAHLAANDLRRSTTQVSSPEAALQINMS